jgi:hypothetical protein
MFDANNKNDVPVGEDVGERFAGVWDEANDQFTTDEKTNQVKELETKTQFPVITPAPPKVLPEAMVELQKAANRNVVAIKDNLDSAGAIVAWEQNDTEINVDALRQGAIQMGLVRDTPDSLANFLPAPPSAKDALTRTKLDYMDKSKVAVKGKGSYLIHSVTVNNEVAEFAAEAILKVVVGELVVEPSTHPMAAHFKERYDHYRSHYATIDVSQWLQSVAKKFLAVPIKQRGSVYYIPPQSRKEWEKICTLVESVSSYEFVKIPATETKDLIKSVMIGLGKEVEETVDSVYEDLKSESGPRGMNVRGYNGRSQRLMAATEKLAAFEKLFDTPRPDLRAKIEECRLDLDKTYHESAQRFGQIEYYE